MVFLYRILLSTIMQNVSMLLWFPPLPRGWTILHQLYTCLRCKHWRPFRGISGSRPRVCVLCVLLVRAIPLDFSDACDASGPLPVHCPLWQCHNLWNWNAVRVYNHSLALWLVTGFEGNIYVYIIYINDVDILYHGLIFILAWISNHMFCKVWNEITYQFTNPKGSDVEVWEWINNFISHSTMSVITFPGYHEC